MNISRNLKNKFFSKELLVSLASAILVFVSDRASKAGIINHQEINKTIFINDYLNLNLVFDSHQAIGVPMSMRIRVLIVASLMVTKIAFRSTSFNIMVKHNLILK